VLDRQVVRLGAIAWASAGVVFGVASIRSVNTDARALVIAASAIGPGAAFMASRALDQRRNRHAGWLLLLSVLTPTFFAWVLNVPALAVGLLLVVAPQVVTDRAAVRRHGA
jgi:hypothetical protein